MKITFTFIFSLFFLSNLYNAQNPRYIFREYSNHDLNTYKIRDYIKIKEIRCENDSYSGDDLFFLIIDKSFSYKNQKNSRRKIFRSFYII
ncbi:hypothetical protein QFZ37_003737 [Chryseobacterium ginsenosidimutans]|nr:hypothetical protein [Chryseobacterium ginsenosidimutans]